MWDWVEDSEYSGM